MLNFKKFFKIKPSVCILFSLKLKFLPKNKFLIFNRNKKLLYKNKNLFDNSYFFRKFNVM